MRKTFYLFGLCLLCACQNRPEQTAADSGEMARDTFPTVGAIERLDPALDELILPDARIEVLAGGMTWSEGPLWLAGQNALIYSDVVENRIHKWTETEGKTTYLAPSGFTGDSTDSREPGSNGLTLDPAGNLVLCQHGDRRIARMTAPLDQPQASFETVVSEYEGKRLNSPNDLIYDSRGNLYFTDPPYGLSEKMMDDPKKELPFQGVFKYAADGTLSLITDQMTRPNGIALSPDERTLYVANSDPEKAIWMAFPLAEDGSVEEGRIFYDATALVGQEKGLPDGMKVDKNGYVFATGPGGVWIFDAAGKALGKIKTGEATANCGFDDTGNTLYITADDYLMRVKMK